MKKKIFFLLFVVLVTVIIGGCGSTNYTQDPGNTTEGNYRVQKEIYKFTKDCPKYFIPDSAAQTTIPPITSNTGSVAWTPVGFVGEQLQVDDKETYIKRLNNATITNQTSYSQYQNVSSAGYPGWVGEKYWGPAPEYQAGYVCFALVYRAFIDAGYSVTTGLTFNSDTFLNNNNFVRVQTNDIKVGDVIAYDWDNNSSYDHLGIITNTSYSTSSDYSVISSIGIVEFFRYGAKETRVGVFNTPSNGGAFSWWQYPNYTAHYYRK